jgi:hypothetical protein
MNIYCLSVISDQLSVISYQFSVFSFQFSVFSFQFSVFSYQFSVIYAANGLELDFYVLRNPTPIGVEFETQ